MKKTYTIEIEAIKQFEVIASSKEEAFKKLADWGYKFHHGNHDVFGEVMGRWIYETEDFDRAKVVYEEDYE